MIEKESPREILTPGDYARGAYEVDDEQKRVRVENYGESLGWALHHALTWEKKIASSFPKPLESDLGFLVGARGILASEIASIHFSNDPKEVIKAELVRMEYSRGVSKIYIDAEKEYAERAMNVWINETPPGMDPDVDKHSNRW